MMLRHRSTDNDKEQLGALATATRPGVNQQYNDTFNKKHRYPYMFCIQFEHSG